MLSTGVLFGFADAAGDDAAAPLPRHLLPSRPKLMSMCRVCVLLRMIMLMMMKPLLMTFPNVTTRSALLLDVRQAGLPSVQPIIKALA